MQRSEAEVENEHEKKCDSLTFLTLKSRIAQVLLQNNHLFCTYTRLLAHPMIDNRKKNLETTARERPRYQE